jgi:hypothetical protein
MTNWLMVERLEVAGLVDNAVEYADDQTFRMLAERAE